MSASPILDAEQQRALALLRASKRPLLVGHVDPDGDCLGAEAALARVLAALGKEVRILNPGPPEARFDYLADEVRFEVYDGGPLPPHDLVVHLDLNEAGRTGPLAPALAAAGALRMIVDHHVHLDEPWWDAAFVDVRAAATGLLVHRIAGHLGVEIDRVAALGVFTSLVTDTGWFKFSNTDSECFAVAAELVAKGVRPDRVYGRIYQRNDPSLPIAMGKLLGRLQYHAGGRLAVIDRPREAGLPELDDQELLLDVLRSVSSVEVVLHLLEQADGACKLSARSRGEYDALALARMFGGGGHAKAAGATIAGDFEDVRARVVRAACEGLDKVAS